MAQSPQWVNLYFNRFILWGQMFLTRQLQLVLIFVSHCTVTVFSFIKLTTNLCSSRMEVNSRQKSVEIPRKYSGLKSQERKLNTKKKHKHKVWLWKQRAKEALRGSGYWLWRTHMIFWGPRKGPVCFWWHNSFVSNDVKLLIWFANCD